MDNLIKLGLFLSFSFFANPTFAQKSNEEVFIHFLNDKKIVEFYNTELKADTLHIVDCNQFLSTNVEDSLIVPKIKLDRITQLSLDIVGVTDPVTKRKEAQKWQNVLWLRYIFKCGNQYIISTYSGFRNKGGKVIYTLKKGRWIGNYYDLGTF